MKADGLGELKEGLKVKGNESDAASDAGIEEGLGGDILPKRSVNRSDYC